MIVLYQIDSSLDTFSRTYPTFHPFIVFEGIGVKTQIVYNQKYGFGSFSSVSFIWWSFKSSSQSNIIEVAPLEAMELFGFAWTSLGPKYEITWIATVVFSAMVGIANISAVYMHTISCRRLGIDYR